MSEWEKIYRTDSPKYGMIDLQLNIYKNGSDMIHENFDFKRFSENK